VDPREVGKITREEVEEYRKLCEKDPVWKQYLEFKRSNRVQDRRILSFLIFLTKVEGREANPITPTELRDRRLSEIKKGSAKSKVKHDILAFLDYLRHTCKDCGYWIEGDPLAPENMPTMACPRCGGTNLSANTRNAIAQGVRGFFRATIDMEGASPFRKGENFPEYGWNKEKKIVITQELYGDMLAVANDIQRVILVLLRQTGMSSDILYIKVTNELMNQLNQEPLPEVVVFPWKRTKVMGKDSHPRYAAICGDGVRIIKSWIEYKNLKPGDYLIPGRNGKPMTKVQLRVNFNAVVKKAGIKTNGERLTPHVMRAAAFTDLVWAKDHDFAKYVTGKNVGIEIITYYNGHLDDIKAFYRKVIPRMNPLEQVRIENKTLKDRLDSLEAENKELKSTLQAILQSMHELRTELAAIKGMDKGQLLKEAIL